jgi:serine/threonine protein kinase
MPDAEPYRAWATFSFTAASGRINECDLLIAVPGGLYLVELKGHPGQAVNSSDTWTFREPGGRPLVLRNPLHLTDLKAKELKGRLEWAARRLGIRQRVPFVQPAVFLSASGLECAFDEVQKTLVFGRDDASSGLPFIWRDLLAKPPSRDALRVTPEFSKQLPRLLAEIGIAASTAHLRYGDDWTLAQEVLDAGPTWEDRLATRSGLVREQGRVRIYLTALQATDEVRGSVERAARREYQVLQGIAHPGIAQALNFQIHQGGPAILFRHDAADLRLDSYLAVHAERLTPATRLDLVRQLAEAVRYAHSRSLYHRALAARSVYVSAREDGSQPRLRIIDWQSAARDFDTSGLSSIQGSSLPGRHSSDAEVYLAPETDAPFADPADLDVFGLGALAYAVLTGEPPAAGRAALLGRLETERGLHPLAVSDGLPQALDALIFAATRADVNERLESAEAFLARLDQQERAAAEVQQPAPSVDPLTVGIGQDIDGDWTVERLLGTGATARALLLRRMEESEDGEVVLREKVLKVALDDDKAARLVAEARALDLVGGGAVVRLLGGPRLLGERTVLDLSYAGERSLGSHLRDEGRLSYHDLERFGSDLFTALDQLAGKGVRHRDLKPDNFGIFHRADRSRQLILFDFSLADVSEKDITVGTRGYLDPFIGTDRRPVYDDQAERYAAAVTLYEMATGVRPVWGDGATAPQLLGDQTPQLAEDLFDPGLREGLTAFFRRALNREVDNRFDTLRRMEDAWRAVFTMADAVAPASTPATVGLDGETLADTREAHAAAATLDTPLEAAGLSPRAVSVAHGLSATTVGELLDIPPYEITRARGAGALIRKELNRRHKQWTAALRRPHDTGTNRPAPGPATQGAGSEGAARPTPGPNGAAHAVPGADTASGPGSTGARMPSIDELAADLVSTVGPVKAGRSTAAGRRQAAQRLDALRFLLGLPNGDGPAAPWPTQADVARRLGIDPASMSGHRKTAVADWSGRSWMPSLRDLIVQLVEDSGRITTPRAVAAALRARLGAADDTPERTLARALAVVRAAVETELDAANAIADGPGRSRDAQSGGSLGAETPDGPGGPRLAVVRRGDAVLIAAESLPGTDDPSPQELADYAVALGRAADDLAARDPLPGRGTVLRDLRAVAPPAGYELVADTRLVELAASVSTSGAAASPRLELYPRRLGLARALRISQAASGVRAAGTPEGPAGGLTVEDLLARVRTRFPEIEFDGPVTHVVVEEALREAGYRLEYDPALRRFRAPAAAVPYPSSTSTSLAFPATAAAGIARQQDVVAAKFDTGIEQGGFLAVTLRGKYLPGTAAAIAARYPVATVDVNREFLTTLRTLVSERGQDWSKVLTGDARFSRTGTLSRGLASYLRTAITRLGDVLTECAADRQVLFLHDAGLLARYWDSGGRELLTGLQNAARRPAGSPFGLWLLCPGENAREVPRLELQTVEVLGEHERVALDGAAIGWLHGERSA